MGSGMILCADIGGSFIDFAVVRRDGDIGHRHAEPTPLHDLEAFVGTLEQLCAPWPDLPLHIAIAGVEDPVAGIVRAANIPCLQKGPLVALLRQRTGRNVLIGNDADCFALAESRFGIAQGYRNVFGVILGTGVGGGYVVDGRVVPGLGGVTGEWGHGPFVVPPPGAPADVRKFTPSFPCGCGQVGCLDTIAGARALERLHVWAGGRAADSQAIVTAWGQGEPDAVHTMEIYLSYLSSALALVVNVTGSMILPVGGGLGSSSALVAAIDRSVRERILVREDRPLVVQAVLGKNAGLLGAACLSADTKR